MNHLANLDQFSRDSLSRHCRNHRPDSNSSNTRSILNRVPRACEACAKSKLRCDGAQICGRCKEKNNTCVYLRKVRTRVDRRRLDKRVEKNHDNDVNDGGENKPPEDMGHMLTEAAKTDTMDMDIHTLELLSQAAFQVATPSPTLDPTGIRQEDTAPKVGYTSLDIESPLPGGSSTSQGVSAGWSTIDSLNPMFDCTEPGVGDEMSPAGFQEFGLEMSDFNASWNQNFDIADWTTLESPYNDIQASYISMGTSPPNSAQPSWVAPMGITEQTLLVHSENFQIDPSLQQEAPNVNFDTTSLETRSRGEHRVIDGVIPRETHHFSHSQPAREQKQGREGNYDGNSTDVGQWPTDWNPRKADNVISFPDMSGTARDVFEAENFAHVEKLSQNTYNSILNCVLQTSKEQKLFRLFRESTLPSLEAFDCFVQLYFEYFQPIMPLIHQATFNPAKASWVLVLAVASIGCRYSKAQGSGKCATALAELCRRAIMLTVSYISGFWAWNY
jgi:hypothetical protein